MKICLLRWIGRLLCLALCTFGSASALAQVYYHTNLGGAVVTRPEVVSSGNGATVFGRGTDDSLWYRDWNAATGAWSAWSSLAGKMKYHPSAVSYVVNGQNVTSVFVTGQYDEVWYRTRNAATWGAWTNLSGQGEVFLTAPAAAALPDGRMIVCGKGATFRLYCKIWNGTQWSGWQDLGGSVGSRIDAVGWDSSKFAVFTTWATYRVWDQSSGWSDWLSTGAVGTNNAFAVTSSAPGRIDVVATVGTIGDPGPAYYRWFDGYSWQGYGLSGSGSEVAIAAAGAGRLSIVVWSNSLWHRRFDGMTWLPWQELLPRQVNGAPAVAALNDGRTHIVTEGPRDTINNQILYPVWNYYFP